MKTKQKMPDTTGFSIVEKKGKKKDGSMTLGEAIEESNKKRLRKKGKKKTLI